MIDTGLSYILTKLLACKSASEARDYVVDSVGKDYKDIATTLANRLTYVRSLNQNALLHKWFDQIAKRDGDKTARDVKGELHHKYALDIRLRDEQFAWVWAQTGAKLTYEQQCSLLSSETLGMSSQMTTKELREYMDAIHRDYSWLPLPEDRK